jgi:pimeloyl-ACP methyl ester carboxylesterase
MNTITSPTGTTVQSQRARRRKGVGFWSSRVLLGLVITLVALAATGAIYQAVATAIDQRTYPAPGQLVDVGGYRLHINCMGQGSPTVILESGLANMSADWANVQPLVAKGTRVCAYDRAGIAWSDPGPQPRDPGQIAAELHTLLGRAGIAGPYVLVGQSFGSLYVRMYAARYSSEVVGMVLVDASHPDMWQRLPAEATATLTGPAWQAFAIRLMARLGLFRLTNDDFANCGLPAVQCAEERAFASSSSKWDTQTAEMYAPERDAQVRDTGNLGARPLVVLTAGDHRRDFAAGISAAAQAQFEGVWRELQAELAALSSNSVHRIVDGAGHQSLQLDHAFVPMTSAAILDVVEAARTGQLLAR